MACRSPFASPALLLWPLLLILAACDLSQTFPVRGRVVGFGDDGRTVFVEHEDIPNLMPAMTMPFLAEANEDLGALAVGDAIGFQFVLSPDSAYIYDLKKLPDDALPAHPAGRLVPEGTPGARPDSLVAILRVGDAVPPFGFTDQDAAPFLLTDYEGRWLLVTFVYTRCPIPTFCPLMSERFAALQPEVKARYGDAVQLLSLTFDPAFDTPPVLRDYAARYAADPDVWRFATGPPDVIAAAGQAFGIFPQTADDGEIMHALTTTLIGPKGQIQALWRGNDWTPDDVLAQLAARVKPAQR